MQGCRTISDLSPHLRLAASDGAGPDGARLLVAAQDLGHAAVGDAELPRDDAGPDAVVGHLHDFMTNVVGQRSAVYENSPQLVDSALTQRSGHWMQRQQYSDIRQIT